MKPCASRSARTARVSRRAAFSVVELIVAVGILGLLAALVLSAVQRVRERAQRLVCHDNLRQMALALHNYHAASGRLPYGTTPDRPEQEMPFLNWQARLLPHLDRESLWREIEAAFRAERDFRKAPPHSLRNRVIATFLCPYDPRSSSPSGHHPEVALTSYLGVQGLDYLTLDGVLFLGSQVALADVRDGTSTTLMVGERPPSWDDRFGWWYAGWGAQKTGTYDAVLGVREGNIFSTGKDIACRRRGPYQFEPGQLTEPCDRNHFWSLHAGGGNFAFADGSARFLTYGINPLFPALASRAGGEPVAVPD